MPTFLERIKARRFSAASSSAVSIGVNGESESRLDVDAGGKLLWGSGSASGDTNLYRSAANTLKSDDAFTAASLAVTGQFTLPTSDGSADQVMVTDGSGSVTWADQSSGGGTPTGAVAMWSGSSAPTGWLECDGSAVSRSTYSALFAVIGTRYGAGDGSTTFNLPNPVDRVAMGIALSTTPSATTLSVSSSLDSLSLGNQSANHSHTITSNAGNQSASHSHTITSNSGNNSANHSHSGSTGNNSANHSHSANTGNAGSHSHNVSNNTVGHSHSYTKPNSGSTGNANTGTQSANHKHNLGNAGSHSHNFNTGNQSANHTHNFNTGNQSANHSHTITSSAGNQSANHSHTITSSAGNQSANHNHALSSSTISSSVNVEPFGFIIKT